VDILKIHTTMTEYDGQTGEVLRQNQTINWGAEPDYVKLYLQDVLYLSDMPPQYGKLLLALLKRSSYADAEQGMRIVLAPIIKREICQEVGYATVQTFDNNLSKLVKGGLLYRVDRGVYCLNPYLFGRGAWTDIAELRMNVSYKPETGRTFWATVQGRTEREEQRENDQQNKVILFPKSKEDVQIHTADSLQKEAGARGEAS